MMADRHLLGSVQDVLVDAQGAAEALGSFVRTGPKVMKGEV
jgi:hypothetical protein